MSWKIIEKRRLTSGSSLPPGIIRLTPRRVTIAGDVAERFQANRRTDDNGKERVALGLAADTDRQALQVIPNPVNGFVFSTPQRGYAMSLNAPQALRELTRDGALATGDYQLVDSDKLIFSRAR
jgi:hypothetical protein